MDSNIHKYKKMLCDSDLLEKPLHFIHFNIEEIWIDKEYIVIGDDQGTNICVDQKEEIVSVDPENEFGKTDIWALSSEENWWSMILEQLELGLV